jgi:transmembrane sensor
MKQTTISTVEDLLADETFIAWYHRSDENALREWNEWILAGITNRALADEAMRLLNYIRVKEKNIPAEQLNAAATRLMQTITKNNQGHN